MWTYVSERYEVTKEFPSSFNIRPYLHLPIASLDHALV